ncbi:hypothetical protein [Amycolatopsis saalfeldensis]|uniref:Sporulation and spore germination n=1 Tax=Amycolatopsis saalfeldensis TaxID=394193 RepID=A0A1H8UFJ3_9PSEU|nr:hypothetical protein [Amycolatopsis saalfeldensis]SEP01673.1 hypothetical protein SAMN04489732_103234 [Amycolatopsis saalfeldensis]
MRTGKPLPGKENPNAGGTGRAVCRIGLVAVVAVVLAGCGVRPSGVIPGGPAPSGPVVPESSQSTVLYFVLGGQPTAAQRQGTTTSPGGVLTLLAEGPDDAERAAGLTTEVPANAAPASVSMAPGDVTVALGLDVQSLSTMATQQIACTVGHLGSAPGAAAVTLTGGGHRRGPLTCPF